MKRGPKPRPVEERFWAKVDRRGPDDCWEWTASTNGVGYGQIGAGGKYGKNLFAHRVAYELLVGPIPDGLQIDHLCRNRGCVNPAHLEPVTQRENILRGTSPAADQARKTHCKNGHPFDEANTMRVKGGRCCRPCFNAWQRERYRRRTLNLYLT